MQIRDFKSRVGSLSNLAIVLAIALECAVFAYASDKFLTVDNLLNVGMSIAVIGILSVGMTFVILTGGIDLGIGSVLALGGVAAAMTTTATGSAVAGFSAAIAIGLLWGVFNGGFVAYAKVPPFVVTLAVLTIARGLAFILSEGRSIGNLPEQFAWLGKTSLVGVPLSILLMAASFGIGWLVLANTRFGRYVYAVGGNPEASFLAGINVKSTLFWVYVLNGLLTGIATVVLASRLGAGVPNSGEQYELEVIAAVVVGGTSLSGGRGSVVFTLFGAVFIGVLNNGLTLAGVDSYLQKIVLGAVILSAVLLDRLNRNS